MNSQNNQRYNSKLAGMPVAMKVSRRRRTRKPRSGYVTTVSRGLPTHYPNAPGDQATFNFKTTVIIPIAASTSSTTGLIALGSGSAAGSISFLTQYSTLFAANVQCYTRFMVESLTVELRATGVGGSANTFVAASYLPSSTSLDAVPTDLNEVAQSNNYTESALGTTGRFTVRPCDYYNDWRMVNNADDNDKQCGLIQFYGSGSTTSSGVSAGVMTISGRIHFCGLRV